MGFIASSPFIYASSEESLLPDGLIINDSFKAGNGPTIGGIQKVQNDAVIIHSKFLKGYTAKPGLPLYKNDTIITLQNSRIRFGLKDNSIINMAQKSKLKLSKSVYDPGTIRSVYLRMSLGKARFIVRKLIELKFPDFNIKTPTTILGVRGSDFIVEVTPDVTTVTALEDTIIEVFSLAYLEVPPTILTSFKSSVIKKGFLPTMPMDVQREWVEQIKEEIMIQGPADDSNEVEDTSSIETNIQENEGTSILDAPPKLEEFGLVEIPIDPEPIDVKREIDSIIDNADRLDQIDELIESEKLTGEGSFRGSW